jgi:hypothetical protein
MGFFGGDADHQFLRRTRAALRAVWKATGAWAAQRSNPAPQRQQPAGPDAGRPHLYVAASREDELADFIAIYLRESLGRITKESMQRGEPVPGAKLSPEAEYLKISLAEIKAKAEAKHDGGEPEDVSLTPEAAYVASLRAEIEAEAKHDGGEQHMKKERTRRPPATSDAWDAECTRAILHGVIRREITGYYPEQRGGAPSRGRGASPEP